METAAESVANVTYSAPTETGEVEVRVDEESLRRAAFAGGAIGRGRGLRRVSAATTRARAAAARSSSSATAS
jgi:hypothetical protein